MRLTQKDIASALGLSLITVNRAINGSESVSPETKKRIQEFINDHNYVPHKASQVLVRNRITKLALFSSILPYYFWNDIRKGINLAADQLLHLDYRVNYHQIPENDTATYIAILKQEIEQGADALAFVNQPIYDMNAVFSCIEEADIPYLMFNVDAADSKRLCYVGTDYYAEGRLAAEVMGKTLHYKPDAHILVITNEESRDTGSNGVNLNVDRLDGFTEVMQEAYPGISTTVKRLTTDMRPHHADANMDRLLKEHAGAVDGIYLIPAVNAIFLESLERCRLTNTVTVIHDLDESASSSLEEGRLTAVIHQNPVLQGYYAVKALERIIETGTVQPLEDIRIIPNVIYAENREAAKNYFELAY